MKLSKTRFRVIGDMIEVTGYRPDTTGRHTPVGKILVPRVGARESLNSPEVQAALKSPPTKRRANIS